MNEKYGLYELWLLWNNEFCVTRLSYANGKEEGEVTYEREVTDYGKCAFEMYDNEFIWDMDGIIEKIVENLEKSSNRKKNIRNTLELQLKLINENGR